MYIDCFQLTIDCLTAQWIVIRLKLHCKSLSFVLKQVFSLRVTGPNGTLLWGNYSERNTCTEKGTLQAQEVSMLVRQITFMMHSNTNTVTNAAI